ncbi:MAG: hypothetical protein WC799_05890 [Desulfobacteraceae bacterium]|jgi:hypothetical protein
MNKWKISFFISLFVLIISNCYWVIEMGGAIAGSHDLMVFRDEIQSKDRSFAVLEDLLTNGNLFKDYNSFVSVASEKYKDQYFVEEPFGSPAELPALSSFWRGA